MSESLSVVIISKNEEKNIEECLKSVQWADEIVLVDDYSNDRTVEIAERYTHRIIQREMEIEGKHRNFAYDQAQNRWILSLDADERVTPELKKEIVDVLSNGTHFFGFTIPRKNFIGNYWVQHGGWYPSGQLKLFQKEKFRYEEVEVHPRAFMNGPCGQLKSEIIHYSYRDFSDFLKKLDNQTTREAKKWFSTGRKMRLGKALWRTLDRFFRTYLVKKGYKDGVVGLVVALFAGFYQILSYAKYWEMKREKPITGAESPCKK